MSQPNWNPAIAAVPQLLDDLMWMGSVVYSGTTIEQYKHSATRRYINLDGSGQAWQVQYTVDGDVGARRIPMADALAHVGSTP